MTDTRDEAASINFQRKLSSFLLQFEFSRQVLHTVQSRGVHERMHRSALHTDPSSFLLQFEFSRQVLHTVQPRGVDETGSAAPSLPNKSVVFS
jgi:hypothetical protein